MLGRLAMAQSDPMGLDEVRRIVGLPVERRLEPAEVEAVSASELTPEAYASGFRLWRQQAEALLAYQGIGGLFAPLRVAGGKTLGTYLIAKHAFQREGIERILFLIPSDLFGKAIKRDVPKMRHLIGLQAPVHGLGGLTRGKRLAMARSGWRGIYVYTYGLLRQEPASEELGLLRPQLVIADEAHNLANGSAAQTRRFLAMMEEFQPRFAGLSGTMAKRSIKNYAHLMELALRDRMPLPRTSGELDTWSSVIDEVGREWEQDNPLDNGIILEPMRVWALEQFRKGTFTTEEVGGPLTPDPSGWRRAFRLRRNTSPGVVASADSDLGVSLTIKNLPVPLALTEADIDAYEKELDARITGEDFFVPADVFRNEKTPFHRLLALIWSVAGIRRTKGRATTPSGDPIQYRIHNHKWLYELAAGFYNELVWPSVTALSAARGIPEPDAHALIERAKEHHQAHRRYAKEVRDFLEKGDHVPGCDTDALVALACVNGGRDVPSDLYKKWQAMQALDFESRPHRVSRVERVSDYKLLAALEWAKSLPKDQGALVWYYNREVGKWGQELFAAEFGERAVHCPAGTRHGEWIQSDAIQGKIILASLKGHSTGKDGMQNHIRENYFIQFPRSADMAEQTLGRTHRDGQKADELVMHTCLTLPCDHQCYAAMLVDSIWAHHAEGEQKVITANYVETPKLYPTEFLQQQGFDVLARKNVDDALKAVLGSSKSPDAKDASRQS